MASQEQQKGRVILVAVDEGEESMYALEWALDTLCIGAFPKDRIVAVYIKPSHATLSGPAFVLTTEAINSLERYDAMIVSNISTTVSEMCAEKKVHVEVKVLSGDPREVITETADTIKASFLVMGSRGFGAIKRALLGSVSDYCIHHVKCPVVIVRRPAELCEN